MTLHHDADEPTAVRYTTDNCELTSTEVVVRTRHGRAGIAAPETIRRHVVNLFPEDAYLLICTLFE